MRNGLVYLLEFTSICLSLALPAAALPPDSLTGVTGSVAQTSSPPDSWRPVEQLAPNTRLKLSATKNGGDCVLQSVSADSLVCLHGQGTRAVQRADIKSIRLARRGRSVAGGLAIGVGAGAALGAGIGSAINSSDSGTIVHVSGGKSAAVGAGLGAIIGGAAGIVVGYSADLFSGPVVYKRQP